MNKSIAIEELNFYRNQHYSDPLGTQERRLADAINAILPSYMEMCEREEKELNKPLTLEELKKIDGEVWICYPQATFGSISTNQVDLSCSRYKFSFEDYGVSWIAYRNKPMEAEEK